jgi:transcriptional enhancer factor
MASSSSSLYHTRPSLSLQRYPHAPDFIDTRRSFHGDTRPPLRESTGNSQSPTTTTSFNGIVSCYQSPVAPSPSMQPNIAAPPPPPPPPVVPSQSFDCLQRLHTPRQHPRYQPHRRGPRHDINPLYFWPAFRQYRNRQAHKDTQKDKGGVWRRPELENAFVDGK